MSVAGRFCLISAKRLRWNSPSRGYPAESWILPLGAMEMEQAPLSLASPLLPLQSPAVGWSSAVPNYVISLSELAGALGAGLNSVCPYSVDLAVLQQKSTYFRESSLSPFLNSETLTLHSGTHFKLSCPNECQIHIEEKENRVGLGGGTASFSLCNKDVQAPSKHSPLIILRLRDLFDC